MVLVKYGEIEAEISWVADASIFCETGRKSTSPSSSPARTSCRNGAKRSRSMAVLLPPEASKALMASWNRRGPPRTYGLISKYKKSMAPEQAEQAEQGFGSMTWNEMTWNCMKWLKPHTEATFIHPYVKSRGLDFLDTMRYSMILTLTWTWTLLTYVDMLCSVSLDLLTISLGRPFQWRRQLRQGRSSHGCRSCGGQGGNGSSSATRETATRSTRCTRCTVDLTQVTQVTHQNGRGAKRGAVTALTAPMCHMCHWHFPLSKPFRELTSARAIVIGFCLHVGSCRHNIAIHQETRLTQDSLELNFRYLENVVCNAPRFFGSQRNLPKKSKAHPRNLMTNDDTCLDWAAAVLKNGRCQRAVGRIAWPEATETTAVERTIKNISCNSWRKSADCLIVSDCHV